MPRLSIRLLGSFEATLDGHPADDFVYDKVRALLTYLAVERNHAFRRDHLAALLWPDQDRRHALQSLSQALYTLRRSIDDRHADPPFLFVKPRTLQFNGDCCYRLDTEIFASALDACRTHAHDDLAQCDACIERLKAAVDSYRGDFLTGIALDDCPAFEEWITVQRERFRRLAGEQLQLLVDVYAALNAPEPALAFASQWLALDPWQEEAHRAVIRVLADSGQQTAALAQYERCRQILADELGVEPSHETLQLVERIRRQRSGGGATQASLPAMLSPLFGRQTEMATLRGLLTNKRSRLISLVGPGGCGKTHLAIAAASDADSQFADGAAFVSLAGLDSTSGIIPAIAEAAGYTFSGEQDIRRQLFDYLRPQQLLLVLDNFEHLLAGVQAVTELLQAAKDVVVLATSRIQLNTPDEQIVVIHGLTWQDHRSRQSQPAAETDAIALFLYHARRLNMAFEPDDGDLRAIGKICRQVDGMPLGILLAASWSGVLRPREIATRLAEMPGEHEAAGIDLLSVEWQALPERQRNMRNVLAYSWQLLDEGAQQVFAALSVFRGGFDAEKARNVAGASLRQLNAYVEKSFLQAESDGRYTFHELLRQFGQEQLATMPALAARTRERHCSAFAESVVEWDKGLRGREQLRVLDAFTNEIDNVRLAWQHAIAERKTGSLRQMIDGLCTYYEWRNRNQAGLEACEDVVSRLQAANEFADKTLLAGSMIWMGWFLFILGRVDTAETTVAGAIDLLDGLERDGEDVRLSRAIALLRMGKIAEVCDRDRALSLWWQSLLLFRQAGEAWWQGQVENELGLLLLNLGRPEEARPLLEASHAGMHLLGDGRSRAKTLTNLDQLYKNQGHIEEAYRVGRESIDLYEKLGDRRGAAASRFEMTTTLMYMGRFSEAEPLLRSAIHDAEALGDRSTHAIALHILGWNQCNLGQYELAQHTYLTARMLLESVESRRGLAMNSLGLGGNDLALGRFHQARRHLLDCASGMRAIGQQDECALALANLALVERGLGHRDAAMAYVRESLQIARSIEAFAPARFALHSYSLLLADDGCLEEAVELYTFVMQQPYFGQSAYRHDIIGRHVEAQIADLSAERRQAAEELGRERDLWATVDEVLAAFGASVAMGDFDVITT